MLDEQLNACSEMQWSVFTVAVDVVWTENVSSVNQLLHFQSESAIFKFIWRTAYSALLGTFWRIHTTVT